MLKEYVLFGNNEEELERKLKKFDKGKVIGTTINFFQNKMVVIYEEKRKSNKSRRNNV